MGLSLFYKEENKTKTGLYLQSKLSRK